MKKTAVLVLIALICSFTVGCAPRTNKASANYNKDKYVFLVAGFDEAAENTDVLFTVSYDADKSEARVAQIPRDTYFAFGKVQNKINQRPISIFWQHRKVPEVSVRRTAEGRT